MRNCASLNSSTRWPKYKRSCLSWPDCFQEFFIGLGQQTRLARLQDKVGPAGCRQSQRLATAPDGNIGMMTRQQLLRNGHALVLLGPRVMRAIQQAGQGGIKGVLQGGLRIVKSTRQ